MTLLLDLDPTSFPGYPVAALNVSFTGSSNAPQFQQSSRNNMRARIFLELLTPWESCMITYWETITLLELYFRSCTPSSSTDRVPKLFSQFFWMVHISVGLAYQPLLSINIGNYSLHISCCLSTLYI